MNRGIGYIDDGRQVFEGFSIRLNGSNGWIELIPMGLAYAELGYDPGNILGMKVVLGTDSFRGEQIVDLPLPTVLRFQTDLNTWDREGVLGFTFPSPSTLRFIPPAVCECTVEHPPWSRRDWQVHCRLSNFEDSSDPNTGQAANMEVYFMLNVESVDSARRPSGLLTICVLYGKMTPHSPTASPPPHAGDRWPVHLNCE